MELILQSIGAKFRSRFKFERSNQAALKSSEKKPNIALWQSEADRVGLVEDACLDNFFRAHNLDVRDWDNLREVMFVIHDSMAREEIIELIGEWLEEGKAAQLMNLSESLVNMSGVRLFRTINKTLPSRQRMIEMGTVEEPVKACVCMAPA